MGPSRPASVPLPLASIDRRYAPAKAGPVAAYRPSTKGRSAPTPPTRRIGGHSAPMRQDAGSVARAGPSCWGSLETWVHTKSLPGAGVGIGVAGSVNDLQ